MDDSTPSSGNESTQLLAQALMNPNQVILQETPLAVALSRRLDSSWIVLALGTSSNHQNNSIAYPWKRCLFEKCAGYIETCHQSLAADPFGSSSTNDEPQMTVTALAQDWSIRNYLKATAMEHFPSTLHHFACAGTAVFSPTEPALYQLPPSDCIRLIHLLKSNSARHDAGVKGDRIQAFMGVLKGLPSKPLKGPLPPALLENLVLQTCVIINAMHAMHVDMRLIGLDTFHIVRANSSSARRVLGAQGSLCDSPSWTYPSALTNNFGDITLSNMGWIVIPSDFRLSLLFWPNKPSLRQGWKLPIFPSTEQEEQWYARNVSMDRIRLSSAWQSILELETTEGPLGHSTIIASLDTYAKTGRIEIPHVSH
jgi:hypothetical protein